MRGHAAEPTDPVALHDGALDATAAIVARLGPQHLSLPTPCTDWDVRRLIDHLVDGNQMFARAVTGAEAEPPLDDCLEAYVRSTEAVRRAWHEPGVLDREVTLPFGSFPGTVAIRMHFVDHLVHGWDLAKATGQDTTIDERLAGEAYEEMTGALDGARRGPGMPFAARVPWPTDAPVHERLVALLGRHP